MIPSEFLSFKEKDSCRLWTAFSSLNHFCIFVKNRLKFKFNQPQLLTEKRSLLTPLHPSPCELLVHRMIQPLAFVASRPSHPCHHHYPPPSPQGAASPFLIHRSPIHHQHSPYPPVPLPRLPSTYSLQACQLESKGRLGWSRLAVRKQYKLPLPDSNLLVAVEIVKWWALRVKL